MLTVTLNVFSLCLVAELSIAPTDIRPVFPCTVIYSHHTRHAHPRGVESLIFYQYRSVSVNLFAMHSYQWYLHNLLCKYNFLPVPEELGRLSRGCFIT